jgi:hypothetical protein
MTPTKAITLDLDKEEQANAQLQQNHTALPELPTVPPIPLGTKSTSELTSDDLTSASATEASETSVTRKATYKRVGTRDEVNSPTANSNNASKMAASSSPPLRLSPREEPVKSPSMRSILMREDSIASNVPADANSSQNPADWVCDYCEEPIGADVDYEAAKVCSLDATFIHSSCFSFFFTG